MLSPYPKTVVILLSRYCLQRAVLLAAGKLFGLWAICSNMLDFCGGDNIGILPKDSIHVAIFHSIFDDLK